MPIHKSTIRVAKRVLNPKSRYFLDFRRGFSKVPTGSKPNRFPGDRFPNTPKNT